MALRRSPFFVAVVLGALLVGLPASAAVKPGKTGGSAAKKVVEQTFSNKEAGVSWSYPKPWEAVSLDDLNKDSERAAQLQYASGKYIAVLTVYRTEDDAPQKTASTLTNDLIKESKKQKNFIKSTTLTINKQKIAGFLRYEPLEGEGREKVFRILIPGEGAYYEAVLGIAPQKTASITSKAAYQLFDKMLAPATAIVQSLRLSKPVEGPTVEYRNNDYAFTLSYPKERWQQDASADGTTDSIGDMIITTLNSPTGSLTIKKAKDTRGSLENYYENVLAQYESAGFTIVSTGPLSHKAGGAYQIEYIIDSDGAAVHFFDTYIAKDDNTIYELSYSAVSTGYFRYLNQVRRAVRSFRFIEPSYTLDTAYEDKKTPARFFYPHEWKIQAPDYINDVVIASSLYSGGIGYSGAFEPTGAPATLEQYTKETIERFTTMGYTDIRQSEALMGGLPAARISAADAKANVQLVTMMTLRGSKANYFSFITSDAATRDRLLPVFEQIIASFQFIE